MRSIGFFMIVAGIILFIISVIVGLKVTSYEHILYISWVMDFCQILVFAGIGFILYDVAMKGDNKLSQLRKRMGSDYKTPRCPECKSWFNVPKTTEVGDTVECDMCGEKFQMGQADERTVRKDDLDVANVVMDCPECNKNIKIPTSAKVGDIAKCPSCKTEFKLK